MRGRSAADGRSYRDVRLSSGRFRWVRLRFGCHVQERDGASRDESLPRAARHTRHRIRLPVQQLRRKRVGSDGSGARRGVGDPIQTLLKREKGDVSMGWTRIELRVAEMLRDASMAEQLWVPQGLAEKIIRGAARIAEAELARKDEALQKAHRLLASGRVWAGNKYSEVQNVHAVMAMDVLGAALSGEKETRRD
jgi:hypothetical protein